MAEALGVAQDRLGDALEVVRRGALAAQQRLGLRSRQGLCATPPSARRASVIVSPSISSAAATDTSANAYDVAVADLQVRVVLGEALRGQIDRRDDLVRPAGCVSRCGVSPGRRWNSANGIVRSPSGPVTRTTASSAASATHMSDGWVAMQCSLVPRIAWMRLKPSMAEQPVPGSRLLQGVAVS